MNKAQLLSLLVIPMVNGSISFIASLTIIICIFRSNLKLSTTYRRLICVLSIFDVFQSFSQLLSSAPMPKGSLYFAAGNNVSCGLQGFLTIMGVSGSMWYSLSLTIYFLMVIKYNLADSVIAKRYEPFLHGFPLIYSVGISIYIYATQNLNPSNTICWISYYPLGCENDPEVDCVNKGPITPDALKWIIAGIPLCVVFILNTILMGIIWLTVRIQTKKSQAYRHSWIASSPHSQQPQQNQDQDPNQEGQGGSNICSKLLPCCPLFHGNGKRKESDQAVAAPSPLAARLSRPSQVSVQRMQRTKNRAIAYIVGYLLTYLFTFIYRFIELLGSPIPFVIILLARFTFPLQGFFNVLIYTYPHVIACRRRNENYSWVRAFCEVIKSGGDSDEVRKSRATRRDSLKKQQRLFGERRQSLDHNLERSNVPQPKVKELPLLDDIVGMGTTTHLDTNLQSPPCKREFKAHVDIRSNQSSPLYIDTNHNSLEQQSNPDIELSPMVLNFGQEDSNIGDDSASDLLPNASKMNYSDVEIGSTQSYNSRKPHREKMEEEEKREIGSDHHC